jgi:hypothetical protein
MKDQINRLGFGAWAENKVINYLENYALTIKCSEGSHTIEYDEYTLVSRWTDSEINITIRAYVDGDGWQTLDQHIRINK